MRLRSVLFILFVVSGCGDDAESAAMPETIPSVPQAPVRGLSDFTFSAQPGVGAVPEELDEPTLSDEITGSPSRDGSLTIDRCKRTGWSYSGCASTYPTQGRARVEWQCRTSNGSTRDIMCARWAQYQLRGIGGPIEREQALATLSFLCQQEENFRHSCSQLVHGALFDNLELARAAVRRGCREGSERAIGCDDLVQLTSDEGMRFEPRVVEVTGLEGVAVGDRCQAWVMKRGEECGGFLACGNHTLYGQTTSSFPCSESGGQLSGGEDMVSARDGDPAFRIDIAAGTISATDDETGPRGAFELRAAL